MLFAESLFRSFGIEPAGTCIDTAVLIVVELVHASSIGPGLPVRRVLLEALSRQDAIARRILDINMDILALHMYHNINVDLHDA